MATSAAPKTNKINDSKILRVVSGSYERLLFGFAVDTATGECDQLFALPAHTSCIRCSAIDSAGNGLLATGGDDDSVQLYSLDTLEVLGDLVRHDASVTAMTFIESSHLLTGDGDGTIFLWTVGAWDTPKKLKGHKGAVSGITVHSSGRLALSVGADKQLICWDLTTGKSATRFKLRQPPTGGIVFSPSCEYYAVVYGTSVTLYECADLERAPRIYSAPGMLKIACVEFVAAAALAVAFSDGSLRVIDIGEGRGDELFEQVLLRSARTESEESDRVNASSRIRALARCTDDQETVYLAAGSSDGTVEVWRLPRSAPSTWPSCPEVFAEFETKSRITCLAIDCITLSDEPEEDDAVVKPVATNSN